MPLISSTIPTIDIFTGEVKDGPLINATEIDAVAKTEGQVNGFTYYSIRFTMNSGRVFAWNYGSEEDRDGEMERIEEENSEV